VSRRETGKTAASITLCCGRLRLIEAEIGLAITLGVGIPGTPSSRTGLVKNANSTWLIGRPLGRDLAAALGRPVRLANDANCFALSEASDGAAAGKDNVFGVILGTGVSGGVVLGGRIVTGANLIAGEYRRHPVTSAHKDYSAGCISSRVRQCVFVRAFAKRFPKLVDGTSTNLWISAAAPNASNDAMAIAM
jgi:fructokinase